MAPRLTYSLPLLAALLVGCSEMPDLYVDDGPATMHPLESPTSTDVLARYTAAPPRDRGWVERTVEVEPVAVRHSPLYFEDPFEDKGTSYKNRLGGEDWIALPYCYARFTLNWLMFPVSAVVTPPWTEMESDGRLSEQLLDYDHDATPAGRATDATPEPPVESEAGEA